MTKAILTGPHPSDTIPTSPRQKRAATVAPSSSFGPDYMAAGRYASVGTVSGIKVELALEAYDVMLSAKASGVIVLAQPALAGLTSDPQLVPAEMTLEPFIGMLEPQEPSIGSPTVGLQTEQ
ncbi:hypothetical protein Nepgr_001244 [Nepenthes gracilis]|uniref:Uncharacterized protein n=1 Tax=Nepenthes gracilis TaxID=150966 RepID=A0AAD3RXL5_NEPGR|nr:hypothetical protein Nepgr_001244 [Nepenthes gracilis]